MDKTYRIFHFEIMPLLLFSGFNLQLDLCSYIYNKNKSTFFHTKLTHCLEFQPKTEGINWPNMKLFGSAKEEFKPSSTCENFTKGCFWSPDGTCLLVPSEDNKVRIYELPQDLDFQKSLQFQAAFHIKEGGTIYDSCWFPFMNSWNPDTCCFLTTARESPVHLWDAFNGQLRATYRAYNQ